MREESQRGELADVSSVPTAHLDRARPMERIEAGAAGNTRASVSIMRIKEAKVPGTMRRFRDS